MKSRKSRIVSTVVCVSLLCLHGIVATSALTTAMNPALNRADLYLMATGAESQLDLQSPIAYTKYYPIAITNTSQADQDFTYYVYAVPTNDTKIDIGGTGYDINLTALSLIYRYEYDMYGGGLNNMQFVGSATGFNLRENERLAIYLPSLGGWTYGDPEAIGNSTINYEGLAYDKWIDAMQGYQGVWNDVSVAERVENARTEGYNEGLADGEESGYASAKSYYLSIQDRLEDIAYQLGWDEAMDQYRETGVTAYWIDVGKIITSYTDGIANIFQSVTNFELFGINVAGVFGAIIAVLVLGFVVSLLLKLFGLLI